MCARCWSNSFECGVGRHGHRASAMAVLMESTAFRQYSRDVTDPESMSRQKLVEILTSSLYNAGKHNCIDRRQQQPNRRYFYRGYDVTLTSSGEDSPDDDVTKHLLRRAPNCYRAFRMPTFAEFVAENAAERRRSRSTSVMDDQMTDIKVGQGQRHL